MTALGRAARQMWVCYVMQAKLVSTAWFEGILGVFYPLMFATSALMVYQLGDDPEAMRWAGLGAAVMGMWSAMGTVAAGLVQQERRQGTLELLVAAPTPLTRTIVPQTMALSTVGLYCVVVTLIWERYVFGLRLDVASWPMFALCILAAAVSLALFGFFLAVTAVRYRTAWTLGTALEYPGWLICGFVVPFAVLPLWVHPIARAIPITWAMDAVRNAADGVSPWGNLAGCAAVGLVYAAAGALLGRQLIDSARRNASLALT